MLLDGKVVIVTGGGRGIGAAISRVLAKHGCSVAVNYNSSSTAAQSVVDDIVASGGVAEAVCADVRDSEAVKAMVDSVAGRFGKLDGLVNNAIGGRQFGSLDEASAADYETAFDFGCAAVINGVKAVRPHMAQHGGGRIINIVTELWNLAPSNWSVYMAGKGAMVGVSRSLACELGPENITVNMVAPGWMVDEKVDPESKGSTDFAQSIPLRRHGSADEIGNACVFLLSELGSYVTGAYIPVTGGRITQMGA